MQIQMNLIQPGEGKPLLEDGEVKASSTEGDDHRILGDHVGEIAEVDVLEKHSEILAIVEADGGYRAWTRTAVGLDVKINAGVSEVGKGTPRVLDAKFAFEELMLSGLLRLDRTFEGALKLFGLERVAIEPFWFS